jgi:hypothetical protein
VRSRVRRVVTAASATLGLASVAACASILGIDPVNFEPGAIDEAGADTLDDSPGNEAGEPDAPGIDGGLEASLFDAPIPDAACLPCGDGSTNPCGVVCDAPTASEFLEVGNGFVFFGSRTKLERTTLDGGGRMLLASGEIGGLAFHGPTKTVAWTVPSANGIHIKSNNGDGPEKLFVVASNGDLHATQLYLTASSVIYFESSDDPLKGGGQGYACDLAAGDCVPSARVLVFLGSAAEQPIATSVARQVGGATPFAAWRTRSVSLDAGSVYAAREGAPDANVKVKAGGLNTMDFMPVAVGENGNAYWTERSADGGTLVVRAHIDTPGVPLTMADTGSARVASIAVLTSGVYLTEPGANPTSTYDGKIVKIGIASPRYDNRPNPGRIVYDPGSDALYWLDRGNPPQTPTLVMRGAP